MFKSTIWAFLGVGSTQITTFIIQIILARILTPSDFGQIALLLVFIAFCDIFVNGGFVTALIQKKNIDDLDYSSTAVFSFTIAIVCYILLYLFSERISTFFDIDMFARKIRILGLIIFPKMLLSIQTAFFKKKFRFKQLYLITVIGNMSSGIIAIIFAKNNFGVYSLIYQQIISTVIIALLLSITSGIAIRFVFDINRFKNLFSFGWKIFVTDFLNFSFLNIRSLIIGKMYPLSALGFFNRGKEYANLATATISSTISTIMLPYLSSKQDSKKESKLIIRRSIQLTVLVVYPLLIGLIVCSKQIVTIILTEKWLPCVIYLQIFALYGFWAKPQIICQEALKAIGLSKRTLQIEIVRKTLEFIVLIISINYGIKAIALSSGIACFLSWFPIAVVSQKDLRYRYIEQINDVLPAFLCSFAMGGVVYFIQNLPFNVWLIFVLQILTALMVYTVLVLSFKIPGSKYLINTISKYYQRRRNK